MRCRVKTECNGTRAESRFGLPAKRTSPFMLLVVFMLDSDYSPSSVTTNNINGLVRFTGRPNLLSARVPLHSVFTSTIPFDGAKSQWGPMTSIFWVSMPRLRTPARSPRRKDGSTHTRQDKGVNRIKTPFVSHRFLLTITALVK